MRISDWSSDVCSSDLEEKISDAAKNAARAAAAVMAMNNVYYRFVHLASNQEYAKMPAKLRMNVIGSPGIDKADFELFSLAVSAMNGCGACIDSHEKVLRDHNVNADIIQTAARVGAVMRSEEHPSEIQALLRLTYAVLC